MKAFTMNSGEPTQKICFRGLICLLAGLVLSGFATLSQATALGLNQTMPDITVQNSIRVSYNAGTQAFSAALPIQGAGIFTLAVDTNPAHNINIGSGSYSINATITNAGVLTGGTASLSGTWSTGTGTIFTGGISLFGYNSASSVYEFVVNVSSGSSALGFGTGSKVGIILSKAPGAGSFASSFNNNTCLNLVNCSTSDNFAMVPEPSSLALLGIGALVARRFSRRESVLR